MPRDRRQRLISLSSYGTRVARLARERVAQTTLMLDETLSAQDVATLGRLLGVRARS
jgi:hypothetical protein